MCSQYNKHRTSIRYSCIHPLYNPDLCIDKQNSRTSQKAKQRASCPAVFWYLSAYSKQNSSRNPESGKSSVPFSKHGTDQSIIGQAQNSGCSQNYLPQHFLYFLPEPQGQGSFRPIFFSLRIVVDSFCSLYNFFSSSSE